MQNYIYINNNSISRELCKDIIKRYESQEDKYDGVTAAGLNKEIKDTKDYIIFANNKSWNKIYNFLNKELTNNINNYLKILNNQEDYNNNNQNSPYKFKIFDKNPLLNKSFMVQKYLKGKGRYIYHDDFSIDYENKKYRAITFLWYLNDVEEGGETVFSGEYKIKPKAGTLVFFPASWCYPHTGKMPLSDDKYILTGWLYVDF
jgi:hypothetical protein